MCSGGGIILFEMLLWPRKSLWRGWRLGRTKLWMTAHIWLGLLTLPLLLLHGGFHFSVTSSTLAAVLMWLLVLVVGSGQLGLVFQNILPRLMLDQVPAETIYSQIGHVLEQYRAEAERLVELTCGRSTGCRGRRRRSSDARRDRHRVHRPTSPWGLCDRSDGSQGKVVQVGIEAQWVPGSEALLTFYRDQIEPYLRAAPGGDCCWVRRHKLTAMFQALKTRLRRRRIPW